VEPSIAFFEKDYQTSLTEPSQNGPYQREKPAKNREKQHSLREDPSGKGEGAGFSKADLQASNLTSLFTTPWCSAAC